MAVKKTDSKKEPPKNFRAWRAYDGRHEDMECAADGLKAFLTACKTERESVVWLQETLEQEGFKPIEAVQFIKPGDRVYMNWKGRGFAAYIAGKKQAEEGFRLVGSHGDSPRIDLKCKPFYEDSNLLMADTQYYGGIKKYLWPNIPLALHGEIHRKDGQVLRVTLGERAEEPLLLIPDLSPHLDRKIAERKANETILGEKLDVIFAHRPDLKSEKDPVLSVLLERIREEWGIEEREMISADISLVPAGAARDAGLDASLIASYGLDDRVCVWASCRALLELPAVPERGALLLVTDREEIGSEGVAGAQGNWAELFVLEILSREKGGASALALRRAFALSKALSADVTEAGNPLYL